jgi:hypothetical protein
MSSHLEKLEAYQAASLVVAQIKTARAVLRRTRGLDSRPKPPRAS